MKATPLPLETTAKTGYTHKFTVPYTDLVALGDVASGHIHLIPDDTSTTLPAGTVVTCVGFNMATPFTHAEAATFVGELGFASAGAGVLMHDRILAANLSHVHYAAENTNATGVTLPYVLTSADSLIFTVTQTVSGGNNYLSEVSAGEIQIFVGLFNQNDLDKD